MSHVLEHRTDGKPGDFFTWYEFERTGTRLPNAAPTRARTCLMILCAYALDPLRRQVDKPLLITSGYRSPQVNAKIGGSKTSAHMTGEAADVKCPGLDAHDLVEAIRLADIDFDQVIAYAPSRGGHVHIGIKAGAPSRHRRQVLWAPASGGYEPYKAP